MARPTDNPERGTRYAEPGSHRLPLLLALSFGALLSTIATIGISPFLLDIARDLNTDLAAAGNLAGNLAGGQLSDRVPAPQLVLTASLVGAGSLALPVLGWAPGVLLSIALGFVYTLVNAAGRPAVLTVLSGFIVGIAGFGGLAMLTFGFGLLGGALSLATWLVPRERPQLVVARGEH